MVVHVCGFVQETAVPARTEVSALWTWTWAVVSLLKRLLVSIERRSRDLRSSPTLPDFDCCTSGLSMWKMPLYPSQHHCPGLLWALVVCSQGWALLWEDSRSILEDAQLLFKTWELLSTSFPSPQGLAVDLTSCLPGDGDRETTLPLFFWFS